MFFCPNIIQYNFFCIKNVFFHGKTSELLYTVIVLSCFIITIVAHGILGLIVFRHCNEMFPILFLDYHFTLKTTIGFLFILISEFVGGLIIVLTFVFYSYSMVLVSFPFFIFFSFDLVRYILFRNSLEFFRMLSDLTDVIISSSTMGFMGFVVFSIASLIFGLTIGLSNLLIDIDERSN
jgi:hypothetical protein